MQGSRLAIIKTIKSAKMVLLFGVPDTAPARVHAGHQCVSMTGEHMADINLASVFN